MKTICRIWLIALVIQPIFFSFAFESLGGLVVIPFELIGSIPGIVVFGLLMQLIIKSKMSMPSKWTVLILIAAVSAFLASYMVCAIFYQRVPPLTGDSIRMLSFAPASALLSIIINKKSVNMELKNERPKEGLFNTSIFNID